MSDEDFGDDDGDDWGDEDGGADDWGDENGGGEWGDTAMVNDEIDNNEADEWEIEVENLFYTAESDRKTDPKQALASFLKCIALEEEHGGDVVDKRFPSLKHVVILLFQLNRVSEMVSQYKNLLSYAEQVSPNDLNSAIRSILNTIQESSDANALTDMYSMTLKYFQSKPGKERVWFEFAMRLCKLHLDQKQNKECEKLLDELHLSCKNTTGEDDRSKGAQLLEIYAIKIQIMSAQNNRVAINELFERTNQLIADVNDPRSMSVIKECWGKMYASVNQWDLAYTNFYEAFRSYQEIGHPSVRQCLKYVVIASMLSDMDTNPFASQEAAVYKTNADIIPVATLLRAFEDDDIVLFESTLAIHQSSIMNDDFVKDQMPAVHLRIRSRVMVNLIKPYKRVRLQWLCKQLNATPEEVENLVVNLILDGSINGRLDQVLFHSISYYIQYYTHVLHTDP